MKMKKVKLPDNTIEIRSDLSSIESIKEILKAASGFVDGGKFLENWCPQIIYRGVNQLYKTDRVATDDPSNDEIKICSGLSVKLQKRYDSQKYSKGDYLNELEKIINDAKLLYPSMYDNMSDLDILADIQHKGGATCLIDFSKNIFTALWFACQPSYYDEREIDSSDENVIDEEAFAYLFCYDIKYDMFVNNAVRFLTVEENSKPIGKLLTNSYRWSNVSSKNLENRFYLWEPSSINSRIIMQDSMFLFGLETFHFNPKNHRVLAIKISRGQKSIIRQALNTYFNINEYTIYRDEVGFAQSRNKLKVTNDSKDTCDLYHKGIEAELEGRYDVAIKMLTLFFLNKNKEERSDEESYGILLDANFSMATCYKNRYKQTEDFNDLNSAIHYYEKSSDNYSKLNNLTEFEKSYYNNKRLRAQSEIVHLCYKNKDYKKAILICQNLYKDSTNSETDKYKYILTQKEMVLLSKMDEVPIEEKYIIKIKNEDEFISENGTFHLIYTLYDIIDNIIQGKNEEKKEKELLNLIKDIKQKNPSEGLFIWNVNSIEKEYNSFANTKNKQNNQPQDVRLNELFVEFEEYLNYVECQLQSK